MVRRTTPTGSAVQSLTNPRAWAKYCRDNGFKNLGGGKAQRAEGYQVFVLELQPDGSVAGDRAPQPDSVVRDQLRMAFDEIRSERIPLLPVPPGAGLPPIGQREGAVALHEYRNAVGELMCCVERFIRPDGDKQCLPWFYYEGEGWVPRDAPDGFPTPLFGNHHNRSRVIIHEGEKAVEAAIKACDPSSGHPWSSFLRRFGHCTWKGGAIAGMVGRANWSEMRGVKEIFLMPDNDQLGYEAMLKVRRQLPCDSVYIVHWNGFEGIVPKKWDIADPCPAITEEDLESAFTLYEEATERRMNLQTGEVEVVVRDEFIKKFIYCVTTAELVERNRPRVRYTNITFNNRFGELAPGIRSLDKEFFRSPHLQKSDRFGYFPKVVIDELGQYRPPPRSVFSSETRESTINLYRPPAIKEREPAAIGPRWRETVWSLRPFLAYMSKMFPVPQERKIVMRWICHNLTVQKPMDRVPWAILLISEMEGTGKSTLGNLLRRILGSDNVSKVEGGTVSDKFTGWLEGIQLAIVEEIKEESAFKLTESLKAKISEPTVSIRRMQTDVYEADNFMSLLASSNHPGALSLSEKDRRWFVPRVTEDISPRNKWQARRYLRESPEGSNDEFFAALWDWFNAGGDRHLLWWFRRYGLALQERGWRRKYGRAPESDRKKDVQERSLLSWQRMIDLELAGEECVVREDVTAWIQEQGGRPPPPDALSSFLATLGFGRMYCEPGSANRRHKTGRTYLIPKPSGGYIEGFVYGKKELLVEPASHWRGRGKVHPWLSDKFKGLSANRGIGGGSSSSGEVF
jgi:hypothetical protein